MNGKRPALRLYLGHLAVTALIFGVYLWPHYATDTYFVALRPDMNAPWVAACARPAAALVLKAAQRLGLHFARQGWISVLPLLLVSAGVSAAVTRFLLKKRGPARRWEALLLSAVGLALTVNVFTQEWYAFPESALPMYALALLFAAWAAFQTERGGKHRLWAVVFLALAVNAYQSALGLYAMLSLLLLGTKHALKNTPEARRDALFVLGNAGGNAVFNVLFCRALAAMGAIPAGNIRLSLSAAGILRNLLSLAHTQLLIWWDAYGLLWPGVPLLCLLLLGVLCVAALRREGRSRADLLLWGVFLLGAYVLVFAPLLFTERVWPAQRSVAGALWLLPVLGGFAFLCAPEKRQGWPGAVLAVFLVLNCISLAGIARDTWETNRADRETVEAILAAVEEYEAAGGATIQKIAFAPDGDCPESYPSVRYDAYDLNTRAFRAEWSDTEILEWVGGRTFTEIPMPEEVRLAHFAGKNWDRFAPEEQLVFDGDTLYIAVY